MKKGLIILGCLFSILVYGARTEIEIHMYGVEESGGTFYVDEQGRFWDEAIGGTEWTEDQIAAVCGCSSYEFSLAIKALQAALKNSASTFLVDNVSVTTNKANGAVENGTLSLYGFTTDAKSATANKPYIPHRNGSNTLKWKELKEFFNSNAFNVDDNGKIKFNSSTTDPAIMQLKDKGTSVATRQIDTRTITSSGKFGLVSFGNNNASTDKIGHMLANKDHAQRANYKFLAQKGIGDNSTLDYVDLGDAIADEKSLTGNTTGGGVANGQLSLSGWTTSPGIGGSSLADKLKEETSSDDCKVLVQNGTGNNAELRYVSIGTLGGGYDVDGISIGTNSDSSIDGKIAIKGFQSAINASTQGTGNQFQIPYAKASSAAESDALTWGNPMTFLDGSFFKTMTKEGSEGKVTLNVTVEQDKDELLVVHGGEGGSTTLEKVEIDNKTIIKDSAKLKVNTKDKGGLVADEPGEGETASAGLYVKTDDSSIKKGTDDGALSVVLADKKGLAKEESGETSSGGLYVNIGDGLEYDNDGKIKTTAFRELDGISISTNESSSIDGKVAIYGFASADEGAGEGDDTYKIPYSCGLGYVYWSNPLEFFSDNFFKLSTAEPGKITLNVDTTSDEDKIAIIHGGTDPSLTTKTLDGKSLEVGGSGSNAKLQIKNFATATKSGNITQLLTDPQASTARQRYSFLAKDANTDGGSLVYLGIDNTIGNFIIPKPDAHSIEYTQSTSGGETNLSIKGAMDDNSNGKILFGAGKDADVVWAKPNEGSFDYDPDVKDFEIYGMTAGVSEPGIDVTGALTNADDNAAFSDTYKFMVRYDDGGEDGAKVGYMDIGGILDMSSSSSNRVDGKSIVRNKDNEDKLEVNGFQGATEGYIPYKNDGEIKWKELSLGAFVDGITLTTNTANGAVESGKASIYGFSTASDGQVPYKDGNTLKWKVAGGGADVDDVSITTNTANGAVESGKASIYGFSTASDLSFPYKEEDGSVNWGAFDENSITFDTEDGNAKLNGFDTASANDIPYKDDEGALNWMGIGDGLTVGASSGDLQVNVSTGLMIDDDHKVAVMLNPEGYIEDADTGLGVKLRESSGLNQTDGLGIKPKDNGGILIYNNTELGIDPGDGIDCDSDGVKVKLAENSGMEIESSSSGLKLAGTNGKLCGWNGSAWTEVSGGGSGVDETTITTNTAKGALTQGLASIKGYRDADAGSVLHKTSSGITWQRVSCTTNVYLAGAGIRITDNGGGYATISALDFDTQGSGGDSTATLSVVTDVRYNETTHKFQKKTRTIVFRGTMQSESEWIDVFNAVSHKSEHEE